MKRLTALFLALLMLSSCVVTAFANGAAPSVKATEIQAGQQVLVTLNMDEADNEVIALAADLYFDSTLFDFDYEGTPKKVADGQIAGASVTKNVKGTAPDTYVHAIWFDAQGRDFVSGDSFVVVAFTAKQNITTTTKATFRAQLSEFGQMDGTEKTDEDFDANSISVTVTPPASAYTGYAVTAVGPTAPIAVGDKAQVTLQVENSNANVTAYNAYYMTVTYDASLLSYAGTDEAITDDKNGTLTIAGYGEEKPCNTDNIVLQFTGENVGVAKVTVESAKVDVKANAVANNAPSATILTKEVTVNVGSYKVTLPADFTGAETATSDKDYTFTAKNNNYDYTFTVKVGESGSATVKDNGNGTYTISKEDIKGNLSIAMDTQIGKTRNVTVEGGAASDVTLSANTATYGTDYTFTITKTLGYAYSVNATAGGKTVAVTEGANGIYTIAGTALTGDVVITVTKSQNKTVINFKGSGAADVVGGTTKEVNSGVDFTFTLNKQLGYTYEVTLGDEKLAPNSDGSYTIPAEKVIGKELTVTVNATKPTYTINASNYVAVSGKNIWLITATCSALTEDTVLKYGDNAMFWSSKYNNGNGDGAYAWLVFSEQRQDKVVADAEKAISIASGSKAEIIYDGDVNMTGVIDINDAQLAWNMYSALYENFDTVTMQKFLKADMDGNGKLDTADAAMIVGLIK